VLRSTYLLTFVAIPYQASAHCVGGRPSGLDQQHTMSKFRAASPVG